MQDTTIQFIRTLAIGQLANAESARAKAAQRAQATREELVRVLLDLAHYEAECERYKAIVKQTEA